MFLRPLKMKIEEVIQNIDNNAIVNPPVTNGEISNCNNKLKENDIPQLPDSFIDFLRICNGMEFNGMQIFGTTNNDIINFTMQNRLYKKGDEEIDNLIFFGRIDDDLYTYNFRTKRYEARDINGLDIWDQYHTFDDFFSKEMMKWLL